jgi:S-DNA-T family DNA segregation ATPase FtsK/SpoIIIE
METKLEFQADRIEAVLALHRVPGRVTGGTVTPRWVRFQILPAPGAKISKIRGLDEELAAALDAQSVRVSRRGAAVAIEVPRTDPQPVRLLPLYRQLDSEDIPAATAMLGLAEDGAPLLIRLTSPDVAHILVAGTTGSGKTVLLQTMIASLALSNEPSVLRFILIDPKGHAFAPFAKLPHLARPTITDVDTAIEALKSLVWLMEKREGGPTIVLVVDELADLLLTGGAAFQASLTRLTQRGREAGIHIIAATQKPTAAVLGPLVKANFPVRLVGRVTSIEDARTASGWSGTGAERLMGQGDFLAVAEGRVVRFQGAHVTTEEIEELVSEMPGTEACFRSPCRVARAGPIVTIRPPMAPAVPRPDDDLVKARLLIASDLWGRREHPDRDDYAWGWMTEACRLLYDRRLEGGAFRKTRRIVRLAEEISTTTTVEEPQEDLQDKIVSLGGGRSSRFEYSRSVGWVNVVWRDGWTNQDTLALSVAMACAGLGLLVMSAGL